MVILSAAIMLLALVFISLNDFGLGIVLMFVAWILAICRDSIRWGKGW